MDENKLKQYADLKKDIDLWESEFKNETKELSDKIKLYQDNIKKLYDSKYKDRIEEFKTQSENIKADLVSHWDLDSKSVKVDNVGTFTLRSSEGIKIFDKGVLVNDLIKRDLILNAVKSFEDKFLKSMLDANVPLGGINLETKKSLAFMPVKE